MEVCCFFGGLSSVHNPHKKTNLPCTHTLLRCIPGCPPIGVPASASAPVWQLFQHVRVPPLPYRKGDQLDHPSHKAGCLCHLPIFQNVPIQLKRAPTGANCSQANCLNKERRLVYQDQSCWKSTRKTNLVPLQGHYNSLQKLTKKKFFSSCFAC